MNNGQLPAGGSGSLPANPTITGNLKVNGTTILENSLSVVSGRTQLDGGNIATDGSGDLSVIDLTAADDVMVGGILSVVGGANLDGGLITSDGMGDLSVTGAIEVGEFISDGSNISSDGSGNLTVKGLKTTSIAAGTASLPALSSTVNVVFATPMVSTAYSVAITLLSNLILGGTFWITAKSVNGFTINASATTASGAVGIDWTATLQAI